MCTRVLRDDDAYAKHDRSYDFYGTIYLLSPLLSPLFSLPSSFSVSFPLFPFPRPPLSGCGHAADHICRGMHSGRL